MIRSVRELTVEQEPFAGGKGRTLARLYRAGYRVPDGFIILPAAFAGDELKAEAWAQVQTHLARLRRADRDASFAVRSSALSEDSAQASFAGEFETVLDVRTDEEIRQAIHAVRRSRHNARVQSLQPGAGAGGDGARNRHRRPAPDPGRFFRRAVHRRPGDGRPDADDGQFRAQAWAKSWSPGRPMPQTFTLARPKGTYSGPAELNRLARALYRNACRLEKELGGPQDIEWAMAGGRLYILQSRPITTLSGYKADTAEWNDSLQGNFLWSGTNLAENAPARADPFLLLLAEGPRLRRGGFLRRFSSGGGRLSAGGHHWRSRVYQPEHPGFRQPPVLRRRLPQGACSRPLPGGETFRRRWKSRWSPFRPGRGGQKCSRA